MVVEFPYGDGSLGLADYQDLKCEVVYPTGVAAIDTSTEFQNILSKQNPVRSIGHFIRDAESAAISIETRYLSSIIQPMLTELLNHIVAGGISSENITILFNEQDKNCSQLDVSSLQTDSPFDSCNLCIHNPFDDSRVVWVGETTASNGVLLCESYVRADFRVGMGAIAPDGFIGATGGGTAVLPNIASRETIIRNHKLRLQNDPRFFDITQPAAEDIAEAARLGGLDYVFNCVIGGSGTPASIVAGSFPEAWMEGVHTSERLTIKDTPHSASIVVIGGGGHPFDSTIYDTVDCLIAAEKVTQHGGTIVLVAQCSDGLGPAGLGIGMTEESGSLVAGSLTNADFLIGMEKARILRRILETRNLIVVGELQKNLVEEVLKGRKAADLPDAIDMALANHPSYPRVVIIPDGRFISFS
ncbi:MAG: DUF2088 domain-containing protein [Candidatus Lokiarchaeota archaeon]|nr:DUF2088 domain-containing protein [Candidatus Lokiarchaeota archaeon]